MLSSAVRRGIKSHVHMAKTTPSTPPTLPLPPAPRQPPHVNDQQMRMVLDVSRMLAVPMDLDVLLCRIAEICCELLGCERASIFLHDPGSDQLWTRVALKSGQIRVPCRTGIVGHAFTHNELVHVLDPYNDPRFNQDPDRGSGFLTRNLLSAPMKGLDGKPLGAIEAVNKISIPFTESDLALIQLLADQAGVAVQRHQLQEEQVRSAEMRREMDLARRTQEALIPKSAPPIAGLTAVGWTLPASETGGDCFDLWKLPDGRLGVLLADASGHGLAPAMIVTQCRSLVRAISDVETDPHRVLDRVNNRLAQDIESGQFVTAFLGFLAADGRLQWSSAGHGPVFFRPRPSEPLRTLEAPVQPLGIFPYAGEAAPSPVVLEEGGALVVVSDGIFEVPDASGEQFGIDRMVGVLDRFQDRPPAQVLEALREAVREWHRDLEPRDDQTIVLVRRERNAL